MNADDHDDEEHTAPIAASEDKIESTVKLICRFKKRIILTTKATDNVEQATPIKKKIKEGQISTSLPRKKQRKDMTPLVPAIAPTPTTTPTPIETEITTMPTTPMLMESTITPAPTPTPPVTPKIPVTLLKGPTTTICEHCNRPFYVEDNYTKHVICCKFFHQTRAQRDVDTDMTIDPLPTPRQQYRLIQELMVRNNELSVEVAKLKDMMQRRNRKIVLDLLSHPANRPLQTFTQWTQSLEVSSAHLEAVFDFDLLTGMKRCIGDSIEKILIHDLPLRTFVEKPNMFYIYDTHVNACSLVNASSPPTTTTTTATPKWVNMNTAEFSKWVTNVFAHRFLQAFTVWKTEQMRTIDRKNDKLMDIMMRYSQKVLGYGPSSDDKRSGDLRKWLHSMAEQPVAEIQYV